MILTLNYFKERFASNNKIKLNIFEEIIRVYIIHKPTFINL